jgi:hypothetical protein
MPRDHRSRVSRVDAQPGTVVGELARKARTDGKRSPMQQQPHDGPNEQWLPAGHQERLAETLRAVANWRRHKAAEALDVYENRQAFKRSKRASFALRTLTAFVRSLPDDDPDLGTFRHAARQGDRYQICPEAWELLSRFYMNRGVHSERDDAKPTEAQMRNVLRRAEGKEQEHRARLKRTPSDT